VLARDRRLLRDPQVRGVGETQGVLDALLVEHRQRPREPEAHRADVGVGLGAELVGAAAEQLGLGRELAVDLEADDRLVSLHAHPLRLAHAHACSLGHSLLAGIPGSLTLMPAPSGIRSSPGYPT